MTVEPRGRPISRIPPLSTGPVMSDPLGSAGAVTGGRAESDVALLGGAESDAVGGEVPTPAIESPAAGGVWPPVGAALSRGGLESAGDCVAPAPGANPRAL